MARGLIFKNLSLWTSLLLVAYGANADEGILLDCTRYDGTEKLQIYINVSKGYVLYDAHTLESFERTQRFAVENHPDVSEIDVDLGLDIVTNDDFVLDAAGPRRNFLYVKENASFAYAWTADSAPKGGAFRAFGNHHMGTCSQRPAF